MTQHLGQHLLSAVLEQELHLDTPSWSLQPFSELSYIEIPRAISPAEIARVQTLCNAHIRADLPVHVDVALEGTDPRPPKMPSDYQGGVIRTVTIGGLDSNSCCGSHPPRLSLLQSLYISPYTTSIRGTNARIYFAVGGRVLAQLGESEKQLRETTSVLSCGAPELSDRVKTLFEDHRAKYRRERRLRTRLAAMEAKEILAIWPEDGVVLKEEADDDAEYLAMIASALAEAGPHRTIALAAQAQTGVEAALLVCGGGEVDHGSALRGAFGGRLKGGGKGRFAGKLSGKWGAEELAILQGVVKSLQ